MGGQVGLFAVMSALRQRARTGQGQAIDISMQDVASWMTAPLWDAPSSARGTAVIACADGHVHCEAAPGAEALISSLPASTPQTRQAFVEQEARPGLLMVPIRTVSEVAQDTLTRTRGLIVQLANARGESWPALRSPMRFGGVTPPTGQPIGLPRAWAEDRSETVPSTAG
jgi:crotonobetainyl-CoA:carnitine CoA-transferase CaiB-like acyl-CoA transferase